MTQISKILGTTAFIACVSFASGASAALMHYTESFTVSGSTGTAPVGSLPNGTFDAGSGNTISNFSGSGFLANPDGAAITFSPLSVSQSGTAPLFTMTWTAGGVTYTFTESKINSASQLSAGNFVVTIADFAGTTTASNTYATQQADFVESFTTSGGTTSFTAGYSTPIPEPITFSLLGVGVAGIAAVRRRRTSV